MWLFCSAKHLENGKQTLRLFGRFEGSSSAHLCDSLQPVYEPAREVAAEQINKQNEISQDKLI